MKKLNLLSCTALFISVLFFVSCDEKDEFQGETLTYKTMELGLDLSKVDLVESKSGAITGDDYLDDSYEVPYCDADLATGDVVVMYCNVVFKDEGGTTVGTPLPQMWQWSVLDITSATGRLSDLVQIDYPIDATMALFTVTDFRVYDSTGTTLKFLTPRESSAYAGYVTTAVDEPFEIDLYEKQYVKLEVLCFDEADIPLFGFAWADFEVISGDEVCIFFNCLEESSAMSFHQVISADIEASYLSGDGLTWVKYWEGSNYTGSGTDISIAPFCVLCPGNWDDSGIKLTVTPTYGMANFDIILSSSQIDDYLSSTTSEWELENYLGTGSVDLSDGTPFIHYVLDDCYKPDAYYSDLVQVDGTDASDVYALSWIGDYNDSTFMMTKLFTADDYCHIAMTPDATKLILATEGEGSDVTTNGWGTSISVYDVYSFQHEVLTFEVPDADDVIAPAESNYFKFTQLVYIDDVLYAACMVHDVLVPIIIDFNVGTFTYGSDFLSMADKSLYDVSGGDLLADEQGYIYGMTKDNNGSVISYLTSTGVIQELAQSTQIADVFQLSGACVLDEVASALTSHWANDKFILRYWNAGQSQIIVTGTNASFGGDMASAYNLTDVDQLKAIFNFTFPQ